MVEPTQIPEPPERTLVIAGEPDAAEVFVRADPLGEPDPWRWWPLRGTDECDPVTWHGVCHTEHVGPEGTTYVPRPVEELVRRSEVDRLVAEARREAGVTPVGKHLKEPGGWCRTCGVGHAETEWARIHDELAEEDRAC